ncbi:hypothetical protein Tco_0418339 [Tanacetum coccineum]
MFGMENDSYSTVANDVLREFVLFHLDNQLLQDEAENRKKNFILAAKCYVGQVVEIMLKTGRLVTQSTLDLKEKTGQINERSCGGCEGNVTTGEVTIVVVYLLWQERNSRIFKEERRDEKTMVQLIKEVIRLKIAGFEVKESKTVKEVEKWNVMIAGFAVYGVMDDDGVTKSLTKMFTVKVPGKLLYSNVLGLRDNGEVEIEMLEDSGEEYGIEVYEPFSATYQWYWD